MGRRDPTQNGKRVRAGTSPRGEASDSSLERAHLFLEAVRAVARAREEAALARTLCQLLVHPALYAEACIAFVDDTLPPRRSYYAGSDTRARKDPERFWAGPKRAAALQALIESGVQARPDAGCPDRILPLDVNGRAVGVLALVAAAGRTVGPEEPGQIEALADDVSYALTQLRSDAPQRALAA